MAISPYDWGQSVRQRAEYIEDRLREGSPVVALTCEAGVLVLTLRKTQRKIFEIYDRLMLAGIGNQADLEAVRLAAIDFAHQEGFNRSPEDVTGHRVVGVALSPALKRAFGDVFSNPLVVRCLFAEMGETPEADAFHLLDYDGEFSVTPRFGVIAGSTPAEDKMRDRMQSALAESPPPLAQALDLALTTWAIGREAARQPEEDEEEAPATQAASDPRATLADELAEATVEAALLERASPRRSKFRLLTAEELAPALERYK